MVTNQEFVAAIFGADAPFCHITGFPDDPSDIANNRRAKCWGGAQAQHTSLSPDQNNYFTISTFYLPYAGARSQRRKSLFRQTHVIVADDVKEKLPVEQVNKLPPPSYKLETSPGSEQWGWILDTPCTDRSVVENLLDGLVAQGLAPSGKDPGMKGVTRYVRLPEAVNTKRSRVEANGGTAPRCRMLEWHPERKVSIEALAIPFAVNLQAERREGRIDGATDLPDHPMLDPNLNEIVHIKSEISAGRFDITCPWVNEHTGEADDGCAVFTNDDGSIGFKCHHGVCEQRNTVDFINHVESKSPGFKEDLKFYKNTMLFKKNLEKLSQAPAPIPTAAPVAPDAPVAPVAVNTAHIALPTDVESDSMEGLLKQQVKTLKTMPYTSKPARDLAMVILKVVDDLEPQDKLVWHESVRDHMHWSKSILKEIISAAQKEWYTTSTNNPTQRIFDTTVFVGEINMFFRPSMNLFLKPEAFQNSYCHFDEDIKNRALMGACPKTDIIDYVPGKPAVFTRKDGAIVANTFTDDMEKGIPGDPTPWLNHFDALGWTGADKDHLLDYMAFTLQHPDIKINHMLVIGGGEGVGKDLVLYPIMKAMGSNAKSIQGSQLSSDFNDYLVGTKLLHINELDSSDFKQANLISNKLKVIATAPPNELSINVKMLRSFEIANIVNCIVVGNGLVPMKMSMDSRRYFSLWSRLTIRGEDRQVKPEWKEYFKQIWKWMRDDEGWKFCVDYLMNRDVSGFDPRESPRITEDMLDIQESSMDPLNGLIEDCLNEELGLFKSDLLKVKDIRQTLLNINQMGVSGFHLKEIPSVNVISRVMKQTNDFNIIRCYENRRDVKVFCIRNFKKYKNMNKGAILKEYYKQVKEAMTQTPLNVAVGG